MRTIASERLLFRPWREDDADLLMDLESRLEVVRFLGANPTAMRSSKDVLASILRGAPSTKSDPGLAAL